MSPTAAPRPAPAAHPAQTTRIPAHAPVVAAPTPVPTGARPAPAAFQPPVPRQAGSFLRATYEVARKEVLQHVRTKRLLIIAPIFLLVMVVITIVLPTSFGREFLAGVDGASGTAAENYVFLLFASGFFILSGYFYLQLMPIVLTVDSVCSEWANKTIFLLLSKPVSRSAFVLGKFAGSAVTVAAVVAPLMVLDYWLMDPFIPGSVDGDSWMRFLSFVGVVLLGTLAFTALSLLVSTLTKSMGVAYLVALAAWIFVFPILGSLDTIIAVSQNGPEAFVSPEEYGVGWSVYLSPGDSMRTASNVLVPEESGGEGAFILRLFGFSPHGEAGWGALALVGQTVLFLGLALWVVRRRNFE